MNHLTCVTSKRNKWYWYLLVLFLSWFVTNYLGAIPLIIVLLSHFIKTRSLDAEALSRFDFKAMGIDLNLGLFSLLFAFAVLLIALIVFIKLFHDRSWTEVINGTNRVRWSRFFFGFLVYGIILLIPFIISLITEPELIEFRFEPTKFFILFVIAVIFIPLQATAEEFIFRGYLAQGIASWTKSRWWTLMIPSLLFGLLHLSNPEIKEYGFLVIFSYIITAFLLGFMSIMDDGIELAMGVHTATNLFGCLLVTFKGSVLQTYALFEIFEVDPVKGLIPDAVAGIVLLAIFAYRYKWNFKILNQKVVSLI